MPYVDYKFIEHKVRDIGDWIETYTLFTNMDDTSSEFKPERHWKPSAIKRKLVGRTITDLMFLTGKYGSEGMNIILDDGTIIHCEDGEHYTSDTGVKVDGASVEDYSEDVANWQRG